MVEVPPNIEWNHLGSSVNIVISRDFYTYAISMLTPWFMMLRTALNYFSA